MDALPTPLYTGKQNTDYTGKPGRSITTRWETSLTETDLGKEVRVVVDLVTSHNKDRQQYETGVYKRTVGQGIERTSYSLMTRERDPQPNVVSRVYTDNAGARYSAKNLEHIHRVHLGLFTDHPAVHATHLQRLITENSTATTEV